ncbi:MAG: hypothetical protein H6R19_909 [Proteobacteria bacterium]|nr:hypothetical protein [Pseudomonadota bacterium]
MSQILLASMRAIRSLIQPGMLWHLLWPALLSALIWVVLGILFIGDLAAAGEALLPGVPLLGKWFVASGAWTHLAVGGLLQILLWCLVLPLIYVSALLLLATVALPLMLERVAARDYADLQRRAGGSQWGSLRTTLLALVFFLVCLLLSLPLWLIPGAGLVISVLLSARLNQRCFSYDALMSHADADELVRLPQRYKTDLTLLGLMAGVLAFVPVLNFVVPAWSGLAFVHYLLEALRRERALPLRDVEA